MLNGYKGPGGAGLIDGGDRAAVYLRISSDDAKLGLAITRQRDACMRLVEYHGLMCVGEYVDEGVSAFKDNVRRPGYDRMKQDFEAGNFGVIVVYDLDRLTRRPVEMEYWLREAERGGARVITATDNIDLATDNGRMYVRIKAAVARAEVERKGARQVAANAQRARDGKPGRLGPALYGYTSDWRIEERYAKHVRQVFEAFIAGEALRVIARALSGEIEHPIVERAPRPVWVRSQHRAEKRAREGLPPEPVEVEKYGRWYHGTVLNMVHNPAYAGFVTYYPQSEGRVHGSRLLDGIVYGDDHKPLMAGYEPIIDEETWTKARAIHTVDRRHDARNKPRGVTLGAKLFYCADCKETLTKANDNYFCYSCGRSRKIKWVDRAVCDIVEAMFGTRAFAQMVATKAGGGDEWQEQEAAIRARLERVQGDYYAGAIDAATYMDAKRRFEEELAAVAQQYSQLQATQRLGDLSGEGLRDAWRSGYVLKRRAVIEAVWRVDVTMGGKRIYESTPAEEIATLTPLDGTAYELRGEDSEEFNHTFEYLSGVLERYIDQYAAKEEEDAEAQGRDPNLAEAHSRAVAAFQLFTEYWNVAYDQHAAPLKDGSGQWWEKIDHAQVEEEALRLQHAGGNLQDWQEASRAARRAMN